MNSMVSATALATATAVDTPSIANAALILGEVSFPALVDRFVRIRERRDAQEDKDKAWAEKIDRLMSDGTDLSREELSKIVDQNPPEDMDAKGRSIAWPKISGELNSVAKAMLRRKPQSIADLAWQTEAVLTADDELCGENEEHPLLPRLLENIRSLAGPLSIPSIVLAADTVDPIFAAIDAHKKASQIHSECVRQHYVLEKTLPREKCKSLYTGEIVEADDPQWINALFAMDASANEMHELARAILGVDPTTPAGAAALLNYIADSGDEDWIFPDYSSGDEEDDDGESFRLAVMRHVGEAIGNMAALPST
jgi:hypothetical protein